MDLRALLHPKEATWNNFGHTWLLDIYDWDLVLVEQNVTATLSFGLKLCLGLFPCSMWIKGQPDGVMQQQGSGYISCLSSDGCVSLRLQGIKFSCDSTQHQKSPIKIRGAYLSVFNSSFTSCVSYEDGGVIQSFDESTVIVSTSSFSGVRSHGFGGAIAAYGSSLHVFNSSFSNTFATRGGGAIWTSSSAYELPIRSSEYRFESCNGFSQRYNAVQVEVKGCAFTTCSTAADGGAILVSSHMLESNSSTERLAAIVGSSAFTYCKASGQGGAIHTSGNAVIAVISVVICSYNSAVTGGAIAASYGVSLTVYGSEIRGNTASESGGAISASYGVSLALHGSEIHNNTASESGGAISANNSEILMTNCRLNHNKALGFGGGALFSKETSIFANGTSCSGNKAPSGGGGVLLLQDSASPTVEVIFDLCKQENHAVYGPCAASECKSLKLLHNFSERSWAGLPLKLAVAKLDAYQQIILTDNSFVQLLPSASNLAALEDQNPLFSFVGSSVSQFVRGYAYLEVAIKPAFANISFDEGVASLKTQPHIFVQSPDSLTGAAVRSGIISIQLGEGSNVCPPGYVLELDPNQAGVCKACQTETYSVNPLASSEGSCFDCPAGALCPDGSCVFHHSLSNRMCPGDYSIIGDWAVDTSSKQFTLRGCPPGYSASNQQCDICPASFYCTGRNVPSRPCPSSSYTPPGANSLSSCVPSVFVTVTINMPVKRPEFKDERALQFQTNLANLTRWDPGYVTIKLVQSGDDPETTTVTSDIVAPDAKVAAALVETLSSRLLATGLAFDSGYDSDHTIKLISVHVSHCVSGYELSLTSKVCQLCPANYFCLGSDQPGEPCPADRGYSPPGSNQSGSCTSAVFVTLALSIPVFRDNFTDIFKSKLTLAISLAAGIASERVEISSEGTSRRIRRPSSVYLISHSAGEDAINIYVGDARRAGDSALPAVHITARLAAENAASAAAIKSKISQANLNSHFLELGLPQGTLISVSIPETSTGNSDQTLSAPTVLGISVGAILLVAVLSMGCLRLIAKIQNQKEYAECVAAISGSNVGSKASDKYLPRELRKIYTPGTILGTCTRGNRCVFKADTGQSLIAIKVVIPPGNSFKFTETELDQLMREKNVLTLLTERRCEYSARLSLGSGQKSIFSESMNMCWYMMDLLEGDNMKAIIDSEQNAGAASTILQGQSGQGAKPIAPVECIHAARDVLAALKVVHDEGMLHLNIQPSNIFRCKAAGESEGREFTYKLIGFGTVVDSNDDAGKRAVARTAVTQSKSTDSMLPYMSPEMLLDHGNALYPADLWSLGTTMFELITGVIPFQQESGQNLEDTISGNMAEKAPNVLDRIEKDKRSELHCSLASVIATALEKNVAARFRSSDEMHGAAFGCLVAQGKASFSVYLSYRAESDGPLAKLLFDELVHSKTPSGHRVTVYLDSCGGNAQGIEWDANIAKGLLHSICYVPIISFGATAPMARFVEGASAQLVAEGWEEAPLGLTRLGGPEQDREDALLKEMLIADALMGRSQRRASDSGLLLSGERGQLLVAFPVFAGRQHPQGHPDYPRMSDYSDVHGGGGSFSTLPSPSTGQAAARFLLDRAGLPVEVANCVEARSVASVVTGLANLQGCQLWNQAGDVREAVLTHEQEGLVGKGYSGPAVNLDDNILSTEQVTCPS